MNNLNREKLSRLARHFPLIKARNYKFGQTTEDNNDSYLKENREAAVWMLENSELFFELLNKYRRITEITSEGEKLNE